MARYVIKWNERQNEAELVKKKKKNEKNASRSNAIKPN